MPETSQTLDRGIRVLEMLTDHPSGMSVTELAQGLGVSRTIVYRLVVTLTDHGFVRRSRDGRCRLGVAAMSLSRQLQPMVRDAAVPSLRRLAEQVGATAHLTVVDGGEAVAVAVVEPSRSDLHVAVREGARLPIDRAVAGRAAIASRLSNRPVTPGWLLSGGGPANGGYAVAAPLLGVTGVEAAVGIMSMTELDPAHVGPRVLAACNEVARSLS